MRREGKDKEQCFISHNVYYVNFNIDPRRWPSSCVPQVQKLKVPPYQQLNKHKRDLPVLAVPAAGLVLHNFDALTGVIEASDRVWGSVGRLRPPRAGDHPDDAVQWEVLGAARQAMLPNCRNALPVETLPHRPAADGYSLAINRSGTPA
ncbi:hypothetical protein [Rhodanobacter sp. OK091]|uniref:hypothetical protein n=1 Tax=Rhodanobacter sp. OK091 TaxID=1881037 RepID=UPI0011603982|nr:hypothetical protein [Rhodanobacter sp. OK091]